MNGFVRVAHFGDRSHRFGSMAADVQPVVPTNDIEGEEMKQDFHASPFGRTLPAYRDGRGECSVTTIQDAAGSASA